MADAFVAGARFGRYTLLRQLAIGGMAEIYLARIDGIGAFAKQVVLKRILAQYARNEEFIEMFLHEARLAAGLQHPNVVQVFDIGEIDGSYFFTMEYVQGGDLRGLLKATRQRNERIPIELVLAYVSEAAAGLHYAHDLLGDNGRPLEIVHRDVSPSNIMVSFDGGVKVADFGIAKAASQTVETRTGTLKGKVSYMSPEQCRGDVLDRRSDVFALGVVLHELVTGKRLYTAENEYAIIRQIIEADAPRLTDVPDVPDRIVAITAKALARDRDVRYATAQELQVDLETLARELKLDGSSVARAAFLRRILGTPPVGVVLEAQASDDEASSVPTTARGSSERTESTALETPPRTSPTRDHGRRIVYGALAVAVTGGLAAAWVLRGDDAAAPPAGTTAAPSDAHADAPAKRPPIVADGPVDASVDGPVDASVDAPVDAPPPDAATKGKKPVVKDKDPCRGWSSSSFEPPPEGCDPTKR